MLKMEEEELVVQMWWRIFFSASDAWTITHQPVLPGILSLLDPPRKSFRVESLLTLGNHLPDSVYHGATDRVSNRLCKVPKVKHIAATMQVIVSTRIIRARRVEWTL